MVLINIRAACVSVAMLLLLVLDPRNCSDGAVVDDIVCSRLRNALLVRQSRFLFFLCSPLLWLCSFEFWPEEGCMFVP